jgi:6-phosphofructokinase 1
VTVFLTLLLSHFIVIAVIRSVPANASDAMYCMLLAQNAVHGVMAGFTAFTTGLVNNRMVYIPIKRIVATSPRVLDPQGRYAIVQWVHHH